MDCLLGVLLLISVYGTLVSGQGCLRALKRNSEPSDPPFDDQDYDPLLASNAVQAIITTYKFYCDCVNITSWETYVKPGGMGQHRMSMAYDIIFQVWRPSPTVQDTGCYSLVGQNNFKFSRGGLVQLTPTPPLNTVITAQSGDVVGYYTNGHGSDVGIQLERSNDYNQNIIWYHTGVLLFGINECQFPVGNRSDRSLRSSTNAAPMLSIGYIEVPCSMVITSTPVPSPTSLTLSLTGEISMSPLSQSPSREFSSPTMQLSVNSGVVLSSMVLLSSTQVLSESGGSIIPLVASVVALLGGLMVLTITIILLVIFFMKRRHSTSKVEFNENELNLSNPNYEASSVQFLSDQQKGSAGFKKKRLFSKPFSKEVTVNFHNKKEELNYETLDDKTPDCAYAEVLSTDSKVSKHIYSKVENSGSYRPTATGSENALYHVVGPNPRLTSEIDSSSVAPSVPSGNVTNMTKPPEKESGYYHVLEGPTIDSNTYEDPKLPKFRESSRKKMMYASTGFYVPTLEERSVSGPAYEEYPKSPDHYKKLQFFVEDDIYWAPATTTSGLYSQLASKKYREIPRSHIRLRDALGSGQFGEVYKATWNIDEHDLELAVKTLKAGASEEDKVKFLQEAAIMGQFSHTNVIKMYGVVTVGEPIYICLEVLENGDLKEFLQGLNLVGSKHGDFKEAQIMFLKFARDIAAGMEYLSKKSFVHRDLAARNILLDKSQTCKVADFGMARDLMDDTYYTSSGGKIPIKWTAPEALLYRKYSTDSDVWSYGMVLFEIWSVARKPFSTLTNSQVLQLTEKGFCQAPPPGCPRAIYELMVDCWNPDHQSRPSFSTIRQKYLKKPSNRLLYWAPEDNGLSHDVGICGAPLEEAEKLHFELQNKYAKL